MTRKSLSRIPRKSIPSRENSWNTEPDSEWRWGALEQSRWGENEIRETGDAGDCKPGQGVCYRCREKPSRFKAGGWYNPVSVFKRSSDGSVRAGLERGQEWKQEASEQAFEAVGLVRRGQQPGNHVTFFLYMVFHFLPVFHSSNF